LKVHKVLLIGILLLGIFLRFQNINWDSNLHLHPDERFLTMVGNAMKVPTTWEEYFDPTVSSLNPANVGYPFFVYGVFPVVLNKILAVVAQNDGYNAFAIQGRILSGLADLIILFFVYKTSKLFEKQLKFHTSIKYWATFLYAISVLPIQLSHFFATDTFLNTFVFASFYFSLSFFYSDKSWDGIMSAFFFGLALASKINAVYILPLVLFLLCFRLLIKKQFIAAAVIVALFVCVSYFTLRITEPYYFESSDFFSLQPSLLFIKNMKELTGLSSGKVFFPPAVQWYSKTPILFSLFNLSFFGLGVPYFVFSIMGIYLLFKRWSKRHTSIELVMIILWVIGYFLYYSIQFAKTMRYLILIYPFLSIFAAFGIREFIRRYKILNTRYFILFILLAWSLIFSSIYLQKHTRYQASFWIHQNLPKKSVILAEYWDDALPMMLDGEDNKQFTIESMGVFDPDTPEKWNKIEKQLEQADYYILSSNRAWASVPTIPDKYPRMGQYYKDLFDGKTKYKLIQKFIPFYQSFFPFHPSSWLNNWFDESFTVYDHPSVFIFQNSKKTHDAR